MDTNTPRCESITDENLSSTHKPRVTQSDSTFSMVNLLCGNERNRQIVPDLPPTANQPYRQTLPSIYETFYDIVHSHDCHIPPSDNQMVHPIVIRDEATPNADLKQSNTESPISTNVVRPNAASTTCRKKKDALDQGHLIDKPPYTYVGLIAMAIHTSDEKMLTLHDIREKLKTWFPFFNGEYTGWRESVRHTLSGRGCFYKTKIQAGTRYHYWAVNYDKVKSSMLVRNIRSKSTQDGNQYHYYLHQQLGVPPIHHVIDKHDDLLRLPIKPSFVPNSPNPADNDFLCARNDDIAAQVDEYGAFDTLKVPVTIPTSEHSLLNKKRKADAIDGSTVDGNHENKRRKTAAVNPTFNKTTSEPKPEERHCKSTVSATANASPKTTPQTLYHTGMYSNHHYVSPHSAPTSLYGYQHHYWPSTYNTDFSAYNQTNSFSYNPYRGYHPSVDVLQQQYHHDMGYPAWPYSTYYGQQDSLDTDRHIGYWHRQLSEPYSAPMNLCKNSDKPV